MSRGGRGGARGGGHMRAHALPFEVDDDLAEYEQRGHVGEQSQTDVAKQIFPPFPEMIQPGPITDDERLLVQIERDMLSQRRAGPFWTGSKAQWAEYEAQSGRATANVDLFDAGMSYGKKNLKRAWRPADLTKIKLDKRFFPRELWDVIDKDEGTDADGAPAKRQKKLGLATKPIADKLAKFDEGADEAKAESEDEGDDNEKENEDEDDDVDRDAVDDEIQDEDDELDNDDYNAEQYFDGGDEDFDEGGGDEYGEDGY